MKSKHSDKWVQFYRILINIFSHSSSKTGIKQTKQKEKVSYRLKPNPCKFGLIPAIPTLGKFPLSFVETHLNKNYKILVIYINVYVFYLTSSQWGHDTAGL